MSRFSVMIIALAMAFASGWLFANKVRPPMLEDVGVAMWMAVGGISFLSAIMASNAR